MTPTLSPSTTQRLKDAHARRETDGFEPLLALVAALRDAGWPLASIANPLAVSREIVRVWAKRAAAMDLQPVTVEPVPVVVSAATIDSEKSEARRLTRDRREAEVLARNLPRLQELKPIAEALRGPSMFSPKEAAASAEYTRLLDETVRAGVRTRVVAEALGIQIITINARLRRSGLRKTAPTERVPGWATPGWEKSA